MQTNKMTFSQAIFSIVLFNFGSSVVMGINTSTSQNAWISIILGALMILPIFMLYARLIQLFPEMNLFEIIDKIFGKIVGKVLIALMVWYALHLSALVLRNFSEFTQVFDMPETPQLPIMILMVITTVLLARSSMRTIGKWSIVALFIVSFVVLFTLGASIGQMSINVLLPLNESTAGQIASSSFEVFAFPYGESVIFLCLADALGKDSKPYKVFLIAILRVVIVFLLVFLRNITLLGQAMLEMSYFPSYFAVRTIEIGNFLARIEGSISSNFMLAGIIKISVCLLAASKGLVTLFGLRSYQAYIVPVGALALALCTMLYQSTMEMFAFMGYYAYYALPFQVLIPVIVWIAAEVYTKRKKGRSALQTPGDALPGAQAGH